MRVRADFLPSGDGGGTGAGVTTGGVGVVGFAVGVVGVGVVGLSGGVGIDGVVCGATHWMNYIVNQLLSN